MKIAWFTPFNKKSAIGKVSRDLCENLKLNYDVDVDIYTACLDNHHETELKIITFSEKSFDENVLCDYDEVVYNMGNYTPYHYDIFRVLERYAGTVILHDKTMHFFFEQIDTMTSSSEKKEMTEYFKYLKSCYGDLGLEARKYALDTNFPEYDILSFVSKFDMLKPILNKSNAIFSHSHAFINEIKSRFTGELSYSYLPIKGTLKFDESYTHVGKQQDKVLIVSTGIVHEIKRIDKVVEILLENKDLAQSVTYVVAGTYGGAYGEKLYNLSQKELKGTLYLTGYVSDYDMINLLNSADICVNLRYPNSEVCSYSLIEQMAVGKATIVINSSFYGEVPDECVYKVDIANERYELSKALTKLVNDKKFRNEIGINAKNFVSRKCTLNEYCENLLELMSRKLNNRENRALVDNVIEETALILRKLNFTQETMPWVVNDTLSCITEILSNAEEQSNKVHTTIGIWCGFPYEVNNLHREGIIRFLNSFTLSLCKNYGLNFEIWTYKVNEKEIRLGFNELLSDEKLSKKINIITECNWKSELKVQPIDANMPYIITTEKDNLSNVARWHSRASKFVSAIFYLDNVLDTGKPVIVPFHDIATNEFYDLFTYNNKIFKSIINDQTYKANRLVRHNVTFVSNSKEVMKNQLYKYVKCIDAEFTDYVYLPCVKPEKNIEDILLPKEQLFDIYSIDYDYIFYPTQVRPYKNIERLVEAFNLVSEKHTNLKLLLTGDVKDVLRVETKIKQLKIEDKVISIGNINEQHLYSLYKYAKAVPVTSYFEGGFPFQATEGLLVDTPIIISDIPLIKERILSLGFELDTCGLTMIDPFSVSDIAKKLDLVISDRKKYVIAQKSFKDAILSYTWDDASRKYYEILSR